jgi:outer membrane protein assembly factor BamA
VSRRLLCSLLFLLACAVAVAQTTDKLKTSYKLLSIHVKGLGRLNENQVVAASGLKIGQFAGDPEFEQALQKLGQTGLFSDLTYSYRYSGGGCDLELQVAENDKLLPIVFENFVWFSDEELLNQIHARVPLFDSRVPSDGDLTEQVAQALVLILDEHKISGEVQYLAYSQENGPIQAYEYKVNFHAIVIRNTDFPGAAPDEVPALQAAAKQLSGSDYSRTNMRAQEQLNFLPIYHAQGYLKAEFADAQARVVEDGARTIVDVSFPVMRGTQYKLNELQITGSTAFPVQQLRKLIHLQPGERANAVQIEEDLQQIKKLYGTKGYVAAHIQSMPSFDNPRATVSYQLSVAEGDVYHMGELNIDGVPAENAARMVAQWQMKKGDPFDDSYLQRFYNIVYRDFDLRKSYEVVPKQAINLQDKTVSVSLHFVPKN